MYPGITSGQYNSLFDPAEQWKIDRQDNLVEDNTLPSGCYHAEYNIPGSGTTYFHKYDPQFAFYPEEIEFAKQWFAANPGSDTDVPIDSSGNDMPLTRADFRNNNYKTHHVRPYTDSKCKRTVYTAKNDCDIIIPFNYGSCSDGYGGSVDSSRYSLNVLTNPGQAGNWLSAFNPNGGIQRLLSNPYYNVIKFDDDALIHLAREYNIAPYFLQNKIYNELEKYQKLFDPSYDILNVTHITANFGITSSPDFSTLTPQQQAAVLIDPLGDFGGTNIDTDDKARSSCTDCASFFKKDTKIQLPGGFINDLTSPSGANYYAYGLVLEKIKQCSIDYGMTADSDGPLYCGCAASRAGGLSNLGQCPGCRDQVNLYCQKQKQTIKQLKYYVVIIRKPKISGQNSCIMIYDLAEQQIVYGGNLNNDDYGSVFCRGGDLICPLDCDIPTKIKEVVWLGDLTTNSVLGAGNCTDTLTANYSLRNIDKTYTGFDDYVYTSITDNTFFKLNNLNNPAGVQNSRLQDFSNIATKIFCRTSTTDYLAARCSICTADNCYSDIIPKLIEFIGQGCSINGFECGGTPSIQNAGITFINGVDDNARSFVTTNSGNPVYWLIESYYNSSYPGLTITSPVGITGIIRYKDTNYLDSCDAYYNNGSNGYYTLDSRFYKEHNISYMFVSSGKIKLSKNLQANGLTASLIIPDDYDGIDWHKDDESWPGAGGFLYNGSNVDTCGGYIYDLPKLNVNGYRPTITVEDLTATKNTTGTKIRIKFKPSGLYFRNDVDFNDTISKNDLNIKILKLNSSNIIDATNYYTGVRLVDISTHDAEYDASYTGYVYFDVQQNITDFISNVTTGNLYLLFNVNNSSTYINWTDKGLRSTIYDKNYKKFSQESDEALDGLRLTFDSSWANDSSYLGDFDLKQIKQVLTGGSFLTVPPITTKKYINGICINIDCTNIGSVCDSLEGC